MALEPGYRVLGYVYRYVWNGPLRGTLGESVPGGCWRLASRENGLLMDLNGSQRGPAHRGEKFRGAPRPSDARWVINDGN